MKDFHITFIISIIIVHALSQFTKLRKTMKEKSHWDDIDLLTPDQSLRNIFPFAVGPGQKKRNVKHPFCITSWTRGPVVYCVSALLKKTLLGVAWYRNMNILCRSCVTFLKSTISNHEINTNVAFWILQFFLLFQTGQKVHISLPSLDVNCPAVWSLHINTLMFLCRNYILCSPTRSH